MSAEDQGGAGRREVAYRLFAGEFEDADFSYSESDEERAPNYVVTPTGARVNRLFVVGVLTEVEQAGEDILRARVVDPTGAFVVYAGQYQPEAQAVFERTDPPAFVAVTGKARTFEPDDSDVVYTSIRPENVNEVSAETRDRWNVQAARHTLDRVAAMAAALTRAQQGEELQGALEADGVESGLAEGISLAIDYYGTTPQYLDAVRQLAVEVAEVVADERDEVDTFRLDPDTPGDVDAEALASLPVSPGPAGSDRSPEGGTGDGAAETTEAAGSAPKSGPESASSAEADETPPTGTGEAETATQPIDEEPSSETEDEQEPAPSDIGEPSAEPTGVTASSETEEENGQGGSTGTTDGIPWTSEAGEGGSETDTGSGKPSGPADVGEFEPGSFELDEDQRESIEEEYGTDFKSGTEVDAPGEADIETPSGQETPGAGAETGDGQTDATIEPEDGGEPTGDDASMDGREERSTSPSSEESEPADESAGADVDLETAVMEAMRANDDGDGAPEAAIVEAVTSRLAVDDSAVEDALEDALMGGQCYEPEDGFYKPI